MTTKLKLVFGELELDASGSEQEVREALRNFMATIEAAIAPSDSPPDPASEGKE